MKVHPAVPNVIAIFTASAVVACATLLIAGCERRAELAAAEAQTLSTQLGTGKPPHGIGGEQSETQAWDATRRFYALRENRPAWIAAGKALPEVVELEGMLRAAEKQGLNPGELGADAIAHRLEDLEAARDPEAAMALELDLSLTLLRYCQRLAFGSPGVSEFDGTWKRNPRKLDIPAVVAHAVGDHDLNRLIAELEPPHPEYQRLKGMLAHYRKLAAESPLVPVPAGRQVLPGASDVQSDAQSGALRKNLIALGDLGADDESLAAAIRRFETRHGLDPDGVPDAAMIAAMNVSLRERVRQIELNMERWRWLPADFGAPYILVNIPGYTLQVLQADETVNLKMRVIVGDDAHRTPVFSGTMTELVFSPFWNIPESIQVREMMPAIIKDPDYFRKKNIEVVRMRGGKSEVLNPSSIEWTQDDSATDVQLRQKPGSNNSLGYVKFLFPNPYNVYLHDTPSDNLFDRLTRDLSHGCVRLEKPVSLAAFVLRDQPKWNDRTIDAAMHAGKETRVALEHPLPVHLVYFTARVGTDGVPQFFQDPYGYDGRQAALASPGAE
ncbi:MAG: L,D-transpeptidase family protein [Panacagrimonas sp.]